MLTVDGDDRNDENPTFPAITPHHPRGQPADRPGRPGRSADRDTGPVPELIDHPSWQAVRRPGGWRELASWAGLAGLYAGAQAVSSLASQYSKRSTRDQYQELRQPSFAPPGPVFPVVWSALNLTTATSAWRLWRVRRSPGPEVPYAQRALAWWALAVLLRSCYVPLEFGSRRYWAATVDSALLCAVMARYAVVARRADPAAAVLAAPEVAWTAFATVLSTAIAVGNT
jgi:benzodiazapine receptor